MSIEIIVPDIGEGKFPVVEVLVSAGDSIAEEEGLVLLESDKATMEVPAPVSGHIVELTVNVGDEVGTGDIIGVIEAKAADEEKKVADEVETSVKPDKKIQDQTEEKVSTEETTKPVDSKPSASTTPITTVTEAAAAPQIDEAAFRAAHASPSIRKLARELGADLGKISGTGRKGRIVETDVKAFVKSVMSGQLAVSAGGSAGIPPIPAQDFSKFGSVEEHKLSKINRLTGEHMTRCWLNIPHVTQYDEADITDLEIFRKSLKSEAEQLGIRVTMLSFLMKALASGMKAYPKFNSSLSPDGQSLIMKQYYHVGIAVDTPNGLVVPVIRDVDQKSIYQLSEDLMAMSKKARDGKLTPADMSGGCMTISSLGGIGGTAFTPIVNAPEVAILGVSRSKIAPAWDGSEFKPRNMLPLSLSYDHRVIDGADGARFTQHLARLLGDARRLLL
ncbi:MAG: dihydrolipoyllysine-residue acetyltransferase [Gammaproteobacteria bacterium]|nr:MAG: dihydrolipoyllysine-residue acetyltransferase [Gammaproteobacteria bacterium]